MYLHTYNSISAVGSALGTALGVSINTMVLTLTVSITNIAGLAITIASRIADKLSNAWTYWEPNGNNHIVFASRSAHDSYYRH